MNATVIVHSEIMETDHVIIMVIVHSEITETDRVTTETVRREIMATDRVTMVSVNSETNGDRSRYDGDRQQRIMATDAEKIGDRPQRQENGDRNGRYERKDNNNQKGFQGNRGGGNSFGGNRNNRQDGQNRSRETRGRLDQEISRMNRDSAKAPIEELRGKKIHTQIKRKINRIMKERIGSRSSM